MGSAQKLLFVYGLRLGELRLERYKILRDCRLRSPQMPFAVDCHVVGHLIGVSRLEGEVWGRWLAPQRSGPLPNSSALPGR